MGDVGMIWTEERTYAQDTAMGFILEMSHADGRRVEHQFRAESLDELLVSVAYFVRGCGFVIDGTDSLDFVPDDSGEHDPSLDDLYDSGYRDGRGDGEIVMRRRAETMFMRQFNIDSNDPMFIKYEAMLRDGES